MTVRRSFVASVFALSALLGPVHADSESQALTELKAQILALQARVAVLESLTTFTSFMPNFSERFHVMHHAGEAGDWAVASHELQEMQRMAQLSESIDAEKGKLLLAMMGPHFATLQSTIEHGNVAGFKTALAGTIDTCNACHAAVGSGFVEVTLEVSNLLSLRHPHKLTPRGVDEGHSHGMVKGKSEMMHGPASSAPAHDDAGKPKHKH